MNATLPSHPRDTALPKTPILVVDASLQGVSLALVDAAAPAGNRILWRGSHSENMGAVQTISRLAAAGLAELRLKASDVRGLAVSTGPGSFTGIKVGLAFAYGWRGASGLDPQHPNVLPSCSLSALSAAAEELASDALGGTVALFLPATRTHGYVALAGGLVLAPLLLDAESGIPALALSLPANTRCMVFGSWPLVTAALGAHGLSAMALAPAYVCELAINGMAEHAARLFPAAYCAALPAPRYLRLSTAEERLKTGTLNRS